MIYQLIDYLINLPSPASSPMALALNGSSALLAELGGTNGPVAGVNLVDNRDTEMNPPMVRFYDTGEIVPLVDFLAGVGRAYMEKEVMQVECAAYGPTVTIASIRAEYLQLAVKGKLQSLIGGVQSAGLPARTDLAGSNSVDVIKRVIITGSRSTKPPEGPGAAAEAQWTVERVLRVEVWVGHSMAAPV